MTINANNIEGYLKSNLPLAFTTLLSWPPKISLNFDGMKLCVLVIAVLFLGPTVSQLSPSSSLTDETNETFPPLAVEMSPSNLSNSSCI